MSNSITYDAAEHDIHSVTVFQVHQAFQTNTAEVTRRIELDLKKGQNEVNIKNLPSILDGNSIRVDGIGKAVVFDVVYKAPQLFLTRPGSLFGQPINPEKRKKESPEIEGLMKNKAGVQRELDVIERQLKVLDFYSQTITSEHAKADALAEFLNTYGTKQLEYAGKKYELQEKIEKIEESIQAAREAEGKASGDKKRGTRIVVIVLAEEDGPAELSLKYNVSGASWTPVYDLRAEISSDGKGTKSPESKSSQITLDYRASISQCTAEDWTNVQLTLSTASPSLGSTIPKLAAIRLFEKPSIPITQYKESARRPTLGSSSVFGQAIAPNAFGGAPPPAPLAPGAPPPVPMARMVVEQEAPPAFLGHSSAKVAESGAGFSSAFIVDGLSTIPSDTDDSSESHKVTISVVQLRNVDLEWVTVPKESLSVFLRAKVKNTSEFTFLPGNASIFMNNNFVAKSDIPLVSPLESFSVSLGMDPSVRVTYHPQSKKVNLPSGGLISSSRTSTTYTQRISIKNTRNVPLARLIVKDQTPVSTNAQIKVNVSEPDLIDLQASTGRSGADARSSNASKEILVSNSGGNEVKARWSRTNDDDENSVTDSSIGLGGEVNTEGFMEWICRVGANSSLDLKLGWEVSVPKGFVYTQC